jgi:hypothetical protein
MLFSKYIWNKVFMAAPTAFSEWEYRARHEVALLYSFFDFIRRVKEFAVEKGVAGCGRAGVRVERQ